MTTLLSAEKYKLLRSRALYVILGCLGAIFAFSLWKAVTDGYVTLGKDGVYAPAAMDFIFTLWFPAFIGFFAAMEFQNGTIRNILCLGKSRLMVYLSKLAAVYAGVAVMILFVSAAATAGYSAAFGFGDIALEEYAASFLRAFLLQIVCFSALASVFTMFAFISGTPIMTVILGVGYIITSLFFRQGLYTMFNGRLAFLAEFFPDYYLQLLAQQGLERGVTIPAARAAVLSLLWAAAAAFIGYGVFSRKDLK
ncbi:MAG: ABC transporter permease [Clostridiales bacterium]|jgi:ABC-2 type transport system permease protein|nr:ABC transporter permease [Clostridiales bacterium]